MRSNVPSLIDGFPITIGGDLKGQVWGLEVWGDFDATVDWRLNAGRLMLGREPRLRSVRTCR